MTDYQISMAVGAFFLLIALTLLMSVIQRPTENEISDLRDGVDEFSRRIEDNRK